jgi:DNA polymerase III epsilon subunit-like protein
MESRIWEIPHIQLSKQKTLVFVDFETTGFQPYASARIIEYSAIKVTPTETTVFHSLAKPFLYSKNSPISIPANIYNLTKINNEMVANCKSTFHEFLKFFEFINGHICIAHNAQFEKTFVDYYCAFLGVYGDITWRCTMKMFKHQYGQGALSKITQSTKAHMAFDDCFHMLRLFNECKQADPKLLKMMAEIELGDKTKKAIFENVNARNRE